MKNLLAPRSVAVVGASQSGNRGTRVLNNLRKAGYTGAVYAVNPKYTEVLGYPCYPDIGAVPEPVDCVVLAVPAQAALAATEHAWALGVGSAVILSSGFGEGGTNTDLAERLDALAREGMRICGPNCWGIVATQTGTATYGGFMPKGLRPGPLALVSQSGGFTAAIANPLVEERNLGFSYLVSCGNQIGVTVEDYIEYFVGDPSVQVILAYTEGFHSRKRLAEVASAAAEKNKPVIVYSPGVSAAARRATESHTGSLAGSPEIKAAALRAMGILQTSSIDEMIETAEALLWLREREALRSAVISISGSGGEGATFSDTAESVGLDLLEFDKSARQAIDTVLPTFGRATNPLDATGAVFEDQKLFRRLLDAVTQPDRSQPVMVSIGAQENSFVHSQMAAFATSVASVAATGQSVLIGYQPSLHGGSLSRTIVDALHSARVPLLLGTENACRAVRHAIRYTTWRAQRTAVGAGSDLDASGRLENPPISLSDNSGAVPYLAATEALRAFSVPVIPAVLARDAAEAEAAAERLGFPVVLKAEAVGLVHKTDAGGVILNCGTGQAVRAAAKQVLENVANAGYTETLGVLVQPMRKPAVEVLVGVIVDRVFGPAVVLALGGIYVEVFKDATVGLPPLSRADAAAMVERLRGRALLTGVRGQEPCDIDALVTLLVNVGAFADHTRKQLQELDLNPVLVGRKGEGVEVVDCFLRLT